MQLDDLNEAQKKEVQDYLKARKILLVDSARGVRKTIYDGLISLGAESNNIWAVGTMKDAIADIKKRQPSIVITEYELGGEFGLDLVYKQKAFYPNPKDKFFMVITGNSSESVVAEAAEEDVDSFLVKPFSKHQLMEYLIKGIRQKLHPSQYKKRILEGKHLIEMKEFQRASGKFIEAKGLNEKPALACYYAGQTYEALKGEKKAYSEYNEGLIHNPIHYKCLIGLFEILEKKKKTEEAYGVIQRLVKHFPVSPQRLGKIFTLAVFTRQFTDVEEYYELFKKIDRRPQGLSGIVSAGLMVCGKHLLKEMQKKRAAGLFREAIVTGGMRPDMISRVVHALIDNNMGDEAAEMLKYYPNAERSSAAYKVLEFLCIEKTASDDYVIETGQKLIREGIKEPAIYLALVQRLMDTNRQRMAETLAYDGMHEFPKMRQAFAILIDHKD